MESLFLRLLNMSLTGALVIAVVALLRLPLRNAPKKWCYLLWIAPAFRLACPVSFRAFFSIFRLKPPAASSAFDDAVNKAELTYIRRTVSSTVPATPRPIPAAAAPGTAAPAPVVPSAAVQAQAAASTDPAQVLLTVAMALWLAGLAVMLIIGVVRYLRMRGRLADAAKLEGGVFASDAIHVPFILGLLPPRVYVPVGLAGKELSYVLAHERAHLRRFDHWVKLLAYLLLSLHWFNPLVWLAFYLMSRDMEMSCDEHVLSGLGGEAKDYSRTLLAFAAGRRFPAPAPLAFGESDVKTRIKNALRWHRPRLWVTITAAVLCLVAVAACSANPYSRWLKDDEAVLEYAIEKYRIEGQTIAEGAYLYGGGDDDTVYKRYLVFLEDDTQRVLTVNGVLRMHRDQLGPEMRVTGFESTDIRNSPWLWFFTVNMDSVLEGVMVETWPEARETALSPEQLGELLSILNALEPEDVTPGRSGPMNRGVKLVTNGETFTLNFDGGMIALAMDDAAKARYPIPEGDPSPEWVLKSGSPAVSHLYDWLEAQWEAASTTETTDPGSQPHLEVPDITADTKDDTVFFGSAEGRLALLGVEGKTNQDVIDAVPFGDAGFRAEDNFLSPGGKSVLSDGTLRPGMSVTEVKEALFGGGFPEDAIREQWLMKPQLAIHTEEEGSDYLITGIYAGQLFDLSLQYSSSGGGVLADIALTFLPNNGEDHALELYALLRSALTQQLGLPQAEELNGHYDREETIYDLKDGHAINVSEPVDYVMAVWWDDDVTLTVRLEIGQKYSRSLRIDFYENIYYTEEIATPEDGLSKMAALTAKDIAGVFSAGWVETDAETLAPLMSAAAAHPTAEPEVRSELWFWWWVEVYLNGGPDLFSSRDEHYDLCAQQTENLVYVRYWDGKNESGGTEEYWLEDPALYNLVRGCFCSDGVVEAEAWEKYGSSLEARAQETIENYEPYGAGGLIGFDITRLEKTAYSWRSEDGEYLPVYAWQVAYYPEDVNNVGWAGGMKLDADNRVVGIENDTYFAVRDGAGGPELTFLSYDTYFRWEGGLYDNWREAYRSLFEDVLLKQTEYTGTVGWPVTGVTLADLSGSGVPELIVFLPGASVSAAAAVVTFEEGEARAFNLENSLGLPPAKNAVDACFWANQTVFDDEDAGFRSSGSGWYLNSRNAAWPAEAWCDWFRFGGDRNGFLACELLYSLQVQGEESFGGVYTETGWQLNGQAVSREEYHTAEDKIEEWRRSLGDFQWTELSLPFREHGELLAPDELTERFDDLLDNWQTPY